MTQPDRISLESRLAAPDAFWAELYAAYRSPPRAYHSIEHIVQVCKEHDDITRGPGWRQPREVLCAILLHDAVYTVGAHDNERQSALLARGMLERHLPDAGIDSARVAALIELTADHGKLTVADLADDPDAAHFLDCDMAILGAAPPDYERYALAVAREYAPLVPVDAYRAGRRAFVQRLLDSPRIFLSEYVHRRLDAPARSNLARELAALGRGDAKTVLAFDRS